MQGTAGSSFWHLYELPWREISAWGFDTSWYQIVMCYSERMYVDTAVAGELWRCVEVLQTWKNTVCKCLWFSCQMAVDGF